MEQSRSLGGEQVLRTSTLIRDRPERGEEQEVLWGESDGPSSTPLRDSLWYDEEARHDFLSIWGNCIYSHHVEPRVKMYVPREESFPIPLKFFDVMLEKNINDKRNVDGERELSDTWTSFTRFTVYGKTLWRRSGSKNILLNPGSHKIHCVEWKPPDGYNWSGGRLTRKQTTSRSDTLWPETLEDKCDASKRKEKQKCAIEKPKFDNARILRGIYFINPDDEEYKDIMKNTRWMLEIPMPAATPCKLQRDKYRETSRVEKNRKTNTLVWLRPTNLWGIAWKDFLTRIMKIILQEKGWIHWVTAIWAQIYSYASSNDNTRCKGSTRERTGKTRENTGMAADESQKTRRRWSLKQGKKVEKFILRP